MGNVLSIMISYRMYKENRDRNLCYKKRKYSDFLKECEDILKHNNYDIEKGKIVKIE